MTNIFTEIYFVFPNYTLTASTKMGAFNMVIGVVSPEVLTHLQNLGYTDHDFFMQWLQNETGVTCNQIAETVYQLQGNWQVISQLNTILNRLLTAHKAENIEELCNWLKSADEICMESDVVQKKSENLESQTKAIPTPFTKDVEDKGTQTDYLSGMTVSEEMVNAIQEGYTNIIKNATQAAVQSSPTIHPPNFAPQINIFTGDNPRKSRSKSRGRPPTKATLKQPPLFSAAQSIGEVTVKTEPEDSDGSSDTDTEYLSATFDDDSPDDDYKPKSKHRRKSTPVTKSKSRAKRINRSSSSDSFYRERVKAHVTQQNDKERSNRIDSFIVSIEPGTKDYKNGYRLGCSSCDFRARVRDSVREHVQRIHIPASDYSCTICGKMYNVMRDLKRHIRTHEVKHVCEVCGNRYRDRRNLELHMKKHEEHYDPKPYACDECSQAFCNQYVLKKHVDSVHRGIKEEHVCVECGKVFTQKHSLQEHAALHFDNRPHVCDVCGASFTYKSSLRSHRKTQHTESEERKFICEICSKAFKTRGSLEKHKVTHDLQKRIPCPRCGKLFTQTSAVTRHMVTHTGEKNHKCTICGQGFNDPSILRRHYSGVHKVEMPRKKAGRPLPPEAQGVTFTPAVVSSSPGPLGIPESGVPNVLSAAENDKNNAAKITQSQPGIQQNFNSSENSAMQNQFHTQEQQSLSSRLPPLAVRTSGDRMILQQFRQLQPQQLQAQSESETPSPYQGQQPALNSSTLQTQLANSDTGAVLANQSVPSTAQQSDKYEQQDQQQSELHRQQQLLLQQMTASNLLRQNQFSGGFF